MAKHIYIETVAPSVAPTAVGHHWINTADKEHYVSVGTGSVGDWIYIPKMSDIGGGGGFANIDQPISDNQGSYQDIVDLILDSNDFQGATVEYTIVRTDGSIYRRESGLLRLAYDVENGWRMARSSSFDDALNVVDSLFIDDTTGQVSYKSDSMGGTYDGHITWVFIAKFASEGI